MFPMRIDHSLICITKNVPVFPKFSGRPSPEIRVSLAKNYVIVMLVGRATYTVNFIFIRSI